jgi:hypothetical protein
LNTKKTYTDPVTGDELTFSEHLSWQLQTYVIRTWWFLITFTLITVATVLTFNLSVVGWWNVLASYLAIFVEAIVGRAMFAQTRRDALIIRELRTLLTEIKILQTQDLKHQESDYEVTLDVNHKLGQVIDLLADEFEPEPRWGEWNEE